MSSCRRCGERPRWRKGEWCADCVFDVCCRHYPRADAAGRLVSCVHGGRTGAVAADL